MSYLEMKRLIKSIKKIYSWYIKINNNSDKNTKDSKKKIAYSSGFACPPWWDPTTRCQSVLVRVEFESNRAQHSPWIDKIDHMIGLSSPTPSLIGALEGFKNLPEEGRRISTYCGTTLGTNLVGTYDTIVHDHLGHLALPAPSKARSVSFEVHHPLLRPAQPSNLLWCLFNA